MSGQMIPGTGIPYGEGGTFSVFRPLIAAPDGLTLSQVSALTGLEGSTIQNWVKRGFVARPVEKKYRERQLARILLICALRDGMRIDDIGELMRLVNGSANDESDDIIGEEQLYDCFCEAVRAVWPTSKTDEAIASAAAAAIGKAAPSDEERRARLAHALETMVCAYVSAEFRKEAEKRLLEMKNGR